VSFVERKCRGLGLRAPVSFALPAIFTVEIVFVIQAMPVIKHVTPCFCVLKPFIGQPKRNK
jgi:hypothetical protein